MKIIDLSVRFIQKDVIKNSRVCQLALLPWGDKNEGLRSCTINGYEAMELCAIEVGAVEDQEFLLA